MDIAPYSIKLYYKRMSRAEQRHPEHMQLNDRLQQVTQHYLEFFPQEKQRLSHLTRALSNVQLDLSSRATIPEGHVCGSGVIVSANADQVLMVLHKKLGIWVVPGGHYDNTDQGSLAQTALREATEEVGLPGLTLHPWHLEHGIPLDIDTHPIPEDRKKGEGAHEHFDFRYALQVPDDVRVRVDPAELLGFQWMNLSEIDTRYSTIAPAVAKLSLLLQK